MKTRKVWNGSTGKWMADKETEINSFTGKPKKIYTPSPEIMKLPGTGQIFVTFFVKNELEAKELSEKIVQVVTFHQVLLNIAKNLEYKRHGKPDSACEVCQTIVKAEGK